MEDFDVMVKILPDGTINLPRVGPISIVNLSLKEAKIKIEKEYEKILKRPIVYLDIIEFRPISLLIKGEVQKPGVYSMGLNRNNNIESATGGKKLVINSTGWPTLIDAIQLAGGVTPKADLKNVVIKRQNNENNVDYVFSVNLWDLLNEGNIRNNVFVYSGDSISISKVNANLKIQNKIISNSNLASSTIRVNVIGEVIKPGLQEIKADSQPISAILSAGGLNRFANKKNIKLFRLNNDGSVFSKKFKFGDLASGKTINLNLLDKDIIIVDSSAWAKTKRNISDITSPILSGNQFFRIFSEN